MTPKEITEKIQRSGPIMMVPSADLQLLAAGYLEAAKDNERLRAELACAEASLQSAPQPPPGSWASGCFIDEYRPWWIRRLLVLQPAIDAAIGGKS